MMNASDPEPTEEKTEPWATDGAEPVDWAEFEKDGQMKWPNMDGDE